MRSGLFFIVKWLGNPYDDYSTVYKCSMLRYFVDAMHNRCPRSPPVLAGPVRALSHNLQWPAIIESRQQHGGFGRAGRMASGSRLTGFPLERTGTRPLLKGGEVTRDNRLSHPLRERLRPK